MKKRVFCCLASLLCWSAVAVRAAKVDTVEVHSRKMGRAVRTIVISPEKTEGKGAAVVYLLHGYGGNETTWPSLKPELKDYADRENLIFVCPNGENSWYWDRPLNEDSQIGTIIPSSTRRANSRMVPYGLFLIAAMMISSLKSTKPSIKSCWNEASCTTLLCVPERIRVNIGAIPSIIKSCFS